jgi:bifunctional pyridoxal-dependent enzyme with beta-cystathionase and maltose regulon repressor activities
MTQTAFISAYMKEIKARYSWAQDAAKFVRFMESVVMTLKTDKATWTPEGEAVKAAWGAIGAKGKPTLKAIRALPLA